uniref:FZ domain-containing protein n=1 Tax=Macrostomum lignano TaxID=282301 RepID=A0A1I8F9K3_9PLAT
MLRLPLLFCCSFFCWPPWRSLSSLRRLTSRRLPPPEWNLPQPGAAAWGSAVPAALLWAVLRHRLPGDVRLPNMLNHESAKEVEEQTKHWQALIRVLLCSIYAPVCIEHLLEKSIQPLPEPMRVCEVLLPGHFMEKFGFGWPDMLNCTQFPPENNLMCIKRSRYGRASMHVTTGAAGRQFQFKGPAEIFLGASRQLESSSAEEPPRPRRKRQRQRRDAGMFGMSEPTSKKREPWRFASAARGGQIATAALAADCPLLEAAAAHPKRRYLLMGSLAAGGDALDVKFMTEWNNRQPTFRRAAAAASAGTDGSAGTRAAASAAARASLLGLKTERRGDGG